MYIVVIQTLTFFSAKLFESFDGPYKPNNILSNAEHLLVNEIHGPESLVYKNGEYPIQKRRETQRPYRDRGRRV